MAFILNIFSIRQWKNNNNSPLDWLVAGGCSSERWEPEREWEDECSSSIEDSGLSDTGAKEICVSRSRKGEKDSLVGSMSWSWLMMSLMDSFMLSSSLAFCLLAAWSPAVLIVTRPEKNLIEEHQKLISCSFTLWKNFLMIPFCQNELKHDTPTCWDRIIKICKCANKAYWAYTCVYRPLTKSKKCVCWQKWKNYWR